MINLTKLQAQQFMLLKHGLIGEYKFIDKQGALDFIYQAGCIQFDPIDICGRNAELTLQSRVKGFTKDLLNDLLYKDRKLFDYYDKCLSIIPMTDWPYFFGNSPTKPQADDSWNCNFTGSYEQFTELKNQVKDYIRENGPTTTSELSDALKPQEKLRCKGGFNCSNNTMNMMVGHLYNNGELIIHHKKGTRKYYDFAKNHISAKILNANIPIIDDFEYQKWHALRRIEAIGLLWNRESDAWLYISGLWKNPQKKENRNNVFKALLNEGKIVSISVDGVKDILYCHSKNIPIIEEVLKNPKINPRCEFIAPLDPFLWDRKLIKTLFDFEYSWEIYTTPEKRKYGVYILPILFGERFIGRIELICEYKTNTLIVKNLWYEHNIEQNIELEEMIFKRIEQFASFHDCLNICNLLTSTESALLPK